MNISELSRQVKIPTKQLREIIPQLGFDVGLKAIQVDDRIAGKIIEKLNNPLVREKYLTKLKEELPEKNIKSKDLPAIGYASPPDIALAKSRRAGRRGQTDLPAATSAKTESTANKILIGEKIVVKDLAKQMGLPVNRLVLELMKNGVMASLNQNIDYETAAIIAQDFGFQTEKIEGEKASAGPVSQQISELLADEPKNLQPRPPVIIIMGHVDHGKTKLLDAIRETNVAGGEAGGITQHIGAYQVKKNNQLITFIDTPGHEAFAAMRSRGAQVADIAILVVAADDGVQPQTIESISHIRSANLPFLVALNKIDKPEANQDKTKAQLAELGLTPEDWGGKTICVPISAKQRQNIDGLLDTLLLVYDMEKEKIQANPKHSAVGTIVESHLDKGEGPVATVLIQTGTLHEGDYVKIGSVTGRIRNMKDWQGHLVKAAPPSMPVKIVGLKAVPAVGEILTIPEDIKTLKKELRKVKTYRPVNKLKNQPTQQSAEENENAEIKKINLLLKTDVLGSQEAIWESLSQLEQPDFKLNIVQRGLGNFTEVDVERAVSQQALLIGFNVRPAPGVEQLARQQGIEIKTSKIIYELLDYVKGEINKKLGSFTKQEVIGKIKIIKIFRTEKGFQIVGGKIISGRVTAKTKLNIYRQSALLGQAELAELQAAREVISEATEGQECGLKIVGSLPVQEGDIIEVVKEEEVERKI